MRRIQFTDIIFWLFGAVVSFLVFINALRIADNIWQLGRHTWRKRLGDRPTYPHEIEQQVSREIKMLDVQQALQAGDRETAVRLLRERTGAPLGVINRHVLIAVRVAQGTDDGPVFVSHAEAMQDTELLDYAAQGLKIHAIKRYRELTGAGLKEAKDTVEMHLFSS